MADERIGVSELQVMLAEQNAGWQAGITSVSELPREEQVRRLGAVPPPGEISLEEIERQVQAGQEAPSAEASAVGAPASYDLRNVSGQNFITPVKDQGSCGSCVAFGVAGAIEGTFRRQRNDANLQVDLSEAHLFYCHGRARGRNCGNGWWPNEALDDCKNIGIADEACYPYTAGDQNCTGRCGDWQSRVIKIGGYQALTSDRAKMKDWIYTRGPITACFIVYQDFFSYRSGVYRYVTGSQAGGHCVIIVGYDDPGGYWICKNSWGTGWGENGFFRIAYGQVGIDTWHVHGVEGILETGWLNNRRVIGLWTINQDRNAWVYLDGNVGWRRIAFDNDNIFFNLLVQLTTAKAANRPVNVYQENAVIKQVYVL